MQHIVVDLEFSSLNDPNIKKTLKNETIEIGAVRLDGNYEYVDSFSTFVRPEHTFVNNRIHSLTGISWSQLENAPLFQEALGQFNEWIGKDRFRIYQWSENDKLQIVNECQYKNIPDRLCNRHWSDVQRLYVRIFHSVRIPTLEQALKEVCITFDGTPHRACDDALNTAYILQTMAIKEKYEEITRPVKEILENPKNGSTLGDLFGDAFSGLFEDGGDED